MNKEKLAEEALNNPLLQKIYEDQTVQMMEQWLDADPETAEQIRLKAIVVREWWRELQFALK